MGAKIEIVDHNGQTPIYYAIKFGRFEMVEFLIQKGANLTNEDKRGQTPSQFAKKHNKLQILDLILKNLVYKYGKTWK